MLEEKKEEIKEEKKEIKKHFKPVNVINSRGKSAVVEWVEDGKAFRKVVPLKDIKDGSVEEKTLGKCPDYGIAWSKEVELKASSEDLEKELHNAGVWTAEDALRNARAIIGALNAAYKTDLASIIGAAKKYINKE
jgi:hypothetical protein